jgi:hypothetical protein
MYIYLYTQRFCSTFARLQLGSYKEVDSVRSGARSYLYAYSGISFGVLCLQGTHTHTHIYIYIYSYAFF